MDSKLAPIERHVYHSGERAVYEWDQVGAEIHADPTFAVFNDSLLILRCSHRVLPLHLLQTFQEVNIYVSVPTGIKSKQLFCEISSTHIRFGMHGNPPYLDKDLPSAVKVSESFWTLEDGTLHIILQKLQQVN